MTIAVGLHHVTDAERGERGEQGKHAAEPGELEPVAQDVHGATPPGAFVVLFAVGDGEDDLGELGGHTQEAGHHEPEQ
jgi:hypothetical protein